MKPSRRANDIMQRSSSLCRAGFLHNHLLINQQGSSIAQRGCAKGKAPTVCCLSSPRELPKKPERVGSTASQGIATPAPCSLPAYMQSSIALSCLGVDLFLHPYEI